MVRLIGSVDGENRLHAVEEENVVLGKLGVGAIGPEEGSAVWRGSPWNGASEGSLWGEEERRGGGGASRGVWHWEVDLRS